MYMSYNKSIYPCVHVCPYVLSLSLANSDKSFLVGVFSGDKFFWFRDEEFARQTLAGLNPYSLKLVTVRFSYL